MSARFATHTAGQPAAIRDLTATPTSLGITWTNGSRSVFNALWLRHSCACPLCQQASTGQKLLSISDLSPETRIVDAMLAPDGSLRVRFAPDGHLGLYDTAWLAFETTRAPGGPEPEHEQRETGLRLWGAALADALPAFDWKDIQSGGSHRNGWFTAVVELGFALLRNVPAEPGYIETVVSSFGRVRENRLGRTFDVKFVPDPSNLAFTAKGLSVHTDNPYRNPVPGLQLLHCLENAAAGGHSVVVDGFEAARVLKSEDPEAFDLITSVEVPFRYKTEDVWFEAAAPVVAVDRNGQPKQVRYNNRSMLAPRAPLERVGDYYAALRHFAEILERPDLTVTFKMAPGDLFVVDNHRVLHGRTAFSDSAPRFLQGAYADPDWIESRYRLGNRPF